MDPNPYVPVACQVKVKSRIPRINGFVQGVRDGLVFSVFLLSFLVPFICQYGNSITAAIGSVLWIPVIWSLSAGLVAELKYRRRVPDASKRSWLTFNDSLN